MLITIGEKFFDKYVKSDKEKGTTNRLKERLI